MTNSKYKVGDIVRATESEDDTITKGKLYKICNVDHDDDFCPIEVVSNNGYEYWLLGDQFELVSTTTTDTYTRILEAMLTSDQVATAKRISEAF